MEPLLKQPTFTLAYAIEAVAALIIADAAIKAILGAALVLLQRRATNTACSAPHLASQEEVWLELG